MYNASRRSPGGLLIKKRFVKFSISALREMMHFRAARRSLTGGREPDVLCRIAGIYYVFMRSISFYNVVSPSINEYVDSGVKRIRRL